MEKDRDFREGTQEYQFMKETIKKKPRNFKGFFFRAALLAAGGALFGISAAAAFSWFEPRFAERFGNERDSDGDVRLITAAPGELQTSGGSTDGSGEDSQQNSNSSGFAQADAETEDLAQTDSAAEDSAQTDSDSTSGAGEAADSDSAGEETAADGTDSGDILAEYQEIYNRALEISEEPRKALVTVSNLSEDSDLLDNSLVSYGDAEGIIFLENDTYLYILTNMENIREDGDLLITFADASAVTGELCRSDTETSLAVVRVSASALGEDTLEEISPAVFDDTPVLEQASPVIAIGSPSGSKDTVMYGAVTAVSATLSVADAEYTLMTTNMQGVRNGSGFLLNADGNLSGVIVSQETAASQIIRALSIGQLRPLIEQLCNEEELRYTGIRGTGISEEQSKALGIPLGIYVESVDSDSPAMEAGIQNGDIITAFDGQEIFDMLVYNRLLQAKDSGDRADIVVARGNAEDEYVDLDLEVTVGTR